jgi:hypothetical protein
MPRLNKSAATHQRPMYLHGVERDKFTFTFTFTPTYRKTETEMVNSISYMYNNTFYFHRSQDKGHTTQAVIILCLIGLIPSKFKVSQQTGPAEI